MTLFEGRDSFAVEYVKLFCPKAVVFRTRGFAAYAGETRTRQKTAVNAIRAIRFMIVSIIYRI